MSKIRLTLILLSITLFGFLLYSNVSSLNKLSKIKVRLPENKNLYNDIFLKDSNLVATLTFISNNTQAPIQTYSYKHKLDVLVFPIKELNTNEVQLPVSSLVSFINDDKPQENITDQIYDGSYKNSSVRFLSLVDSLIVKKTFKVYFDGISTTKPIINNNLVSYSLYSGSLKITTKGLKKILFYLENLHSFTQPKISMEILFFKKDTSLYTMLIFPKNNEIIKTKPELINLLHL